MSKLKIPVYTAAECRFIEQNLCHEITPGKRFIYSLSTNGGDVSIKTVPVHKWYSKVDFASDYKKPPEAKIVKKIAEMKGIITNKEMQAYPYLFVPLQEIIELCGVDPGADKIISCKKTRFDIVTPPPCNQCNSSTCMHMLGDVNSDLSLGPCLKMAENLKDKKEFPQVATSSAHARQHCKVKYWQEKMQRLKQFNLHFIRGSRWGVTAEDLASFKMNSNILLNSFVPITIKSMENSITAPFYNEVTKRYCVELDKLMEHYVSTCKTIAIRYKFYAFYVKQKYVNSSNSIVYFFIDLTSTLQLDVFFTRKWQELNTPLV